MNARSTQLREFADPAEFENLTEAEFEPVRRAILQFSKETAMQIAKALNAK